MDAMGETKPKPHPEFDFDLPSSSACRAHSVCRPGKPAFDGIPKAVVLLRVLAAVAWPAVDSVGQPTLAARRRSPRGHSILHPCVGGGGDECQQNVSHL